MPVAVSSSQTGIVFLLILVGFFWFIKVARRRSSDSWRLKAFFLGGARVGPDLTEHNTLGITFAWSGGTWFFALMGYHFGPWVVLLQIPWCFSIVLLAVLYRRILSATRDRTIHGYLGERYGGGVQIIAAAATSLGYVVNTGFELFWAALMFAPIMGRPDLIVPVALLLAVVTGLYCSIGGYISNAETDKPQNLLGVIALAVLLFGVAEQLQVERALQSAARVFLGGSLLYVIVSLFQRGLQGRRASQLQTALAIVFVASACVLPFTLLKVDVSPITHLANSPLPVFLLVGLISFQTLFNAIDMANWQQVAANGDLRAVDQPAVQWAITRGAAYLFWFPALGGTLLGCVLRSVSNDIADENLFTIAFSHFAPDAPPLVRAVLFGLLLLGFLSTSLSTADSMIMSAAQTVTYDISSRHLVRELVSRQNVPADPARVELEAKIVARARRLLIPVALLMVLAFWFLYAKYKADAVNFQSMMYAFPLSLFTPVMFGLFAKRVFLKAQRVGALCGICLSLAVIATMFAIAVTSANEDAKNWLLNLMPLASIASSTIGVGFGWVLGRIFARGTIAAPYVSTASEVVP